MINSRPTSAEQVIEAKCPQQTDIRTEKLLFIINRVNW